MSASCIPDRVQPGQRTLSGFQNARARPSGHRPTRRECCPPSKACGSSVQGNQRWLVVNLPPDRVYPLVREFWQESGFLVQTEMPEAGILETDWAENRAKVPQDFIRNALGKVLDSCIPPVSATSSAPAWSRPLAEVPRSSSRTAG
jgi:outer membrane protein assembly factor BamC